MPRAGQVTGGGEVLADGGGMALLFEHTSGGSEIAGGVGELVGLADVAGGVIVAALLG